MDVIFQVGRDPGKLGTAGVIIISPRKQIVFIVEVVHVRIIFECPDARLGATHFIIGRYIVSPYRSGRTGDECSDDKTGKTRAGVTVYMH
ncbi:hypothetical protein D3C81_1927600 [compost metagenome]